MVPVFLYIFFNLVGHSGCRCAILGREFEGSHVIKADFPDEITELFEIFLRFSRETHHEGGTDSHSGGSGPKLVKQGSDACRRIPSVHALQHGIADMLERNIHVLADFIFLQNHVQQLIVKISGIQIEQTDPFHPFNLYQLPKKGGQVCSVLQIPAIAGKVLCNEVEFPCTLSSQSSHLMNNGRNGTTVHGSSHIGNVAECAAIAAAFCNFHIGGVLWCQGLPWNEFLIGARIGIKAIHLFILFIGFIHRVQNVLPGIGTNKYINFRDFLSQRFFILLGQTASGHQLFTFSCFLVFRRLQNGLHRFLFGGVDKGTGINNNYLCFG